MHQAGEEQFSQVVHAKRVLEPRVPGARIHQMDEAQLADVPKALEVFGVYEGEKRRGDVDIPPDRVADGLAFFFQQWVIHGRRS